MKKLLIVLFFLKAIGLKAQTAEAEQLLLNWEKLAQLKTILQNMYEGYSILKDGYDRVKNISEGNFDLHHLFLDRLLQVNPVVKNYKKVGDIVHYQLRIVRDCQSALKLFQSDAHFASEELLHIKRLYARQLRQSARNLDELLLVITSGQLRMSDAERLNAIDRIYAKITHQAAFIQDFNNSTKLLSLQRSRAREEVELSKKLHAKP